MSDKAATPYASLSEQFELGISVHEFYMIRFIQSLLTCDRKVFTCFKEQCSLYSFLLIITHSAPLDTREKLG